MGEFISRMQAQRAILQVVNKRQQREDLFGLSSQAIDRWMSCNAIDSASNVVDLLRAASEQLSFLANKSQMQVSDEYRRASLEISALTDEIRRAL
jgi:hypothetical protein